MEAVLIDYGASNLHSVHKALEQAGFTVVLTDSPEKAAAADVLISPGQGHFGQVMEQFLASGFEPVVRAHLASGKPFLGICVGLQILMDASEEAPNVPGLGLLPGVVKRFPESHDEADSPDTVSVCRRWVGIRFFLKVKAPCLQACPMGRLSTLPIPTTWILTKPNWPKKTPAAATSPVRLPTMAARRLGALYPLGRFTLPSFTLKKASMSVCRCSATFTTIASRYWGYKS